MFSSTARKKLVQLFLLAAIFHCGDASGDNEDAKSKSPPREHQVERGITIDGADVGLQVRKELDLGLFRPGTSVRLKLHVKNESGESFGFDRIVAGCKCLSISPNKAELHPGQRVDFDITLSVPSATMRARQEAAFRATHGGVFRFSVLMRYSGSGVVGFGSTAVRIKVPKGTEAKLVPIPFFADALSPPELIDLELSENLSSAGIEMDYRNKQVKLKVPVQVIKKGRVTGQLHIRNIETGSHGQITVDIAEEGLTAVYPSVVRLNQNKSRGGSEEGAESPIFSGNVALHNRGADKQAAVHAEFSIDGKPISANKLRGRNGVVFYKIIVDDSAAIEEIRKGDASVRCSVVIGKSRDEHILPVILSSNLEVR